MSAVHVVVVRPRPEDARGRGAFAAVRRRDRGRRAGLLAPLVLPILSVLPILPVLLVLPMLAAGCAGTSAFSTRFPDNQPKHVEALVARLEHLPPSQTTPAIAVGVSPQPSELYAFDLASRRLLWRFATDVTHPPLLAGPRVVTQEGSQVVARDLASGRRVFSLPTEGLTLNGADGDATRTVLSLSAGQGTMARARVVMVQGSSVRWQHVLAR